MWCCVLGLWPKQWGWAAYWVIWQQWPSKMLKKQWSRAAARTEQRHLLGWFPFSHLLFPSLFYSAFSTWLCGVPWAVSGGWFQPSSWWVAKPSETLVTHNVTKIIVLKTHSGNWCILFQLFLLLLFLSIEWTPSVTFLSFFHKSLS